MGERALRVEQPMRRPEQSGLARGEGSCQEAGTLKGLAMYFYCFESLKKEAPLALADDPQLPPLMTQRIFLTSPQETHQRVLITIFFFLLQIIKAPFPPGFLSLEAVNFRQGNLKIQTLPSSRFHITLRAPIPLMLGEC